jgi:hypothetical protein
VTGPSGSILLSSSNTGDIKITTCYSENYRSGSLFFKSGDSFTSSSGDISLNAGQAANSSGGNVIISAGNNTGNSNNSFSQQEETG